MDEMRTYSDEAWNIASLYSRFLASETRDLAAHIDKIVAERDALAAQVKALKLKAGINWDISELTELAAQLAVCREALETFVNRVEAGEVRSRTTYTQFKELLALTPPAALEAVRREVREEFKRRALDAIHLRIFDGIEEPADAVIRARQAIRNLSQQEIDNG